RLDPFYFRGTIEGTARRPVGHRLQLGARAFAGWAGGDHPAPRQRQIYAQGADPLEQYDNPFLRSRGALLAGEDFNYQMPGGGGVRGADSRLSSEGLVALNVELERELLTRPAAHLFNRITAAAFGDIAHGISGPDANLGRQPLRFLADAGVGFRAAHRIGQTEFVTRFDFPLVVSRAELAQDVGSGDQSVDFRWTFSFQPAF
ncbi:MAG: hypothetical protein H0W67_07945, partial [Gemmatimonadales bacterium]|nr:hypothetical protein [Gemmatimonadales bacterium]